RGAELEKEFADRRQEQNRRTWERVQRDAWIISVACPPGWLAAGVSELSAGAVLPALLGTLGFGLIGAASLRRAYRTTVRLYTGGVTRHGQAGAAPATGPAPRVAARAGRALVQP